MSSDLRSLRPAGGFRLIHMDPAWRFETFDGESAVATQSDDPYPTMSLQEIAALPVSEIGALDCWLTMWTTWPMLEQALKLINGWGFTYKTGGPWAKQTSTGKHWQFGTGYIFRSASEPLLVASRGNPKWLSRSERNLWVAPVREHSRKPDCVHEMLERCTSTPRLEMFSRSNRDGWTHWGNETGKFG